jgi:hypothetical protein
LVLGHPIPDAGDPEGAVVGRSALHPRTERQGDEARTRQQRQAPGAPDAKQDVSI